MPRVTWSGVQGAVGLTAALISVLGGIYSGAQLLTRSNPTGDVVAVVQDARTQRPVSDAIVEVLTPNEALITTLDPEADGRARGRVREGTYRLRVQHPRYAGDARSVHIRAGHTTEVRMGLTPRAGSPQRTRGAERAIQQGARAIQRLVRGLVP